MSASSSNAPIGPTSVHDELIPLGHNWFIHNPNQRSVRVRYEAIPSGHHALPAAEVALEKIVRALLQITGCRASLVPCLHRGDLRWGTDELPVILHVTLLHVEVLDMVHLMDSTIPVHLYIGDPLTTGSTFDAYSPEKLVLPDRLLSGDPIFCPSTERVTVFAAYLHSPDGRSLYGLTAGHAVVSHAGFTPHPRLLSHGGKHQRSARGPQPALQHLGQTLSNPAVKIVERAILAKEAERMMLWDEREGTQGERTSADQRRLARLRQHDAEQAALRDALARPHEFDIGHACAAEAIIRPCHSSDHDQPYKSSRGGKGKGADHTHLLSWTLIRMAPRSQAGEGPITLRAHPGTLERDAAVATHVRDPNLERPLGPFRDGVVNGAPASVVLDGYVAREWAVFPAPATRAVRFAARGDAGALVTSIPDGESSRSETMPLAMLYAVPERGPYGLVTPLKTIMRRIRDVTGMQLRFQGGRWRDGYG